MRTPLLALFAVSLIAARAATATESEPSAAGACRGTTPNHTVGGQAFSRAQFNYGGANLRAHLGWRNGWLRAGVMPDGGSMATIEDDGSISTKQGWWRGTKGKLVVTGRRLDRAAPSLRGGTRPGYGETGFIPVSLTFPTTGCWRITGTLGALSLTYVVRVTRLPS